MHDPSTGFPQPESNRVVIPLMASMNRRLCGVAGVALACALTAFARPARAATEDATLLRVFLRDGATLVSYGELARVGDRVIFSMPTGPLPNPPLHLVNLPAERIDWEKTESYAVAARADRYLKGQAELDYAALSGQLAQALNDVAGATDARQRLAIVEQARQALAAWPAAHYNYREPEVHQMVGMLDEAIADLRAASGASRFNLTLEAHTEPAAPMVPLLPAPTLQESIEQVLVAARAVDNSVERSSLLASALGRIEADKERLPADWLASTRAAIEGRLAVEARIDRSYQVMSSGILQLAEQRARHADVRGVMRLIARVQVRDQELGASRPETVSSLLAAVEAKLDAARRLRLARDRYELRLPLLTAYATAIKIPIGLFTQTRPSLEAIKTLSGSSRTALEALDQATSQMLQLVGAIAPPEELAAAHALFASAVQMAANAASTRREASLDNNMDLAWNASSAAAGALMLGSRARTDILALLRPPQLR
jgi:hypothetical protein